MPLSLRGGKHPLLIFEFSVRFSYNFYGTPMQNLCKITCACAACVVLC